MYFKLLWWLVFLYFILCSKRNLYQELLTCKYIYENKKKQNWWISWRIQLIVKFLTLWELSIMMLSYTVYCELSAQTLYIAFFMWIRQVAVNNPIYSWLFISTWNVCRAQCNFWKTMSNKMVFLNKCRFV